MSSTSSDTTVPPGVAAVIQRYRRTERLLRLAVVGPIAVAGGGAVIVLPLVAGLVVAAILVAAVRMPLLRPRGTAQLTTDTDPEAVVAAFTGPTPPLLAFQWGIADGVEETADGVVYEFTYLLGLRSLEMETTARRLTPDDAAGGVELLITENGRPWARYEIRVADREDGTDITVDWASQRRFGLGHLSQALAGRRYRTNVLTAQGYDIERYDVTLV